MKEFFKKLIGFSIGPIAGAMISFITIPVTSHLVSADQFGLTNMYTLATNIITLIVILGIDQAFVRQYNETKDKKKLLLNSLLIPLIATIIIGIILIIFKKEVSYLLFENDSLIVPIILLALSMPLFIIERFMLLSIRMQEKAFEYSAWNIISKVLNLIFVMLFLLFYKRNFESIVYANILSQSMVSILLMIMFRRNIEISIKNIDKQLMTSLIKFGLPLVPATIIGWGLNSMDSIFLRTMSTYTELGYYTVSLKVSNVLGLLQTSFATFWSPMAFKWKANHEKREKFQLVMDGVGFVMSIVLMLILLLKDLIPIVFGKDYNHVVYIIPFLLFYPIFYTMSETTVMGIYFSKKTGYNIVVSILSIIVNLFLNFLLVPRYEAIGAAIATGISYIVFFWVRTLLSRKLWFAFQIRKFVIITIILFGISLSNCMIRNTIAITILNSISLVLIIFVYKNIVNMLLQFRNKMKEKDVVS